MKNQLIWRILLVILSAAALVLAAAPNSVTVVLDSGAVYGSFFAALPDGSYPLGLAAAGMLCGVCFALAAVYAVLKKPLWLRCTQYTALAAACFSVLPLVLGTKPPVLPNVAVTVLLCAVTVLAIWLNRHSEKQTGGKAPLKKN